LKNCELSEIELRECFIKEFSTKSGLVFHKEVPVFCRSVDLVIQETETSFLTAIEFKIHDWKRAIIQVRSVEICFEYLFICLPKPKTLVSYNKIISACEANGIGLYFYDSMRNTFEKIREGIKATALWEAQKKQIISYLEAK